MSNFTDFFPAAAGGGIGQTITVGDYSYPNAQSLANFVSNKVSIWGNSGTTSSAVSSNVYELRDAPNNYGLILPSDDTYATVADVTGATNGGACYGIFGVNTNTGGATANRQFTFRITLDGGSPVEYAFYNPSSSKGQFSIMGKNWVINHFNDDSSSPRLTSGQSAFTQDPYYGGLFQSYFNNYDTNTNTFWSNWQQSSQDFTLSVIDTITASTMGLPFVYFTSSLKVEVKITSRGSTGDVRAGASILTF